MRPFVILPAAALIVCLSLAARAADVQIIPPGEQIRPDRPRILLRPKGSSHAIGLDQLKALKRDAEFAEALGTLRGLETASAQAMVWLLTGEQAAAQKAIARLKAFDRAAEDAFDVWFGLRELSLAYDWLHEHPGFSEELKKQVRDKAFVLVDKWGLPKGEDHVFHNYTWMNNCGLALWALASYGDDPRSAALLKTVRFRFHGRLFPAMERLNGQAGDAMGYWHVYCTATCIWTLMAIQSAFEIDAMAPIREGQHDWLARQLDGVILGTLPDMRFIPWGDIQQGPDGGVTHEIAGVADAVTWALCSRHGVFFSRWLAGKRSVKERFFTDTALLYLLYTRHLTAEPAAPPLAMLGGGEQGGQVMMRSAWSDDATVVGFRCTDYYQGHFHYDVGSFVIYRNGLLAVDAGIYRNFGGHQIRTDAHDTLLLGGQPQRPVRGQWYKDLAEFDAALKDPRDGRRLETGDMPFYKDAGEWTAAAGQFAQAYASGTVQSCVRQLLYVRPNTVVIVDNLVPEEGKNVPEVKWMLHVPSKVHRDPVKLPDVGKGVVTVTNEKSWLRCRDLLSDQTPGIEESYLTQLGGNRNWLTGISRVNFLYAQQSGDLVLVHLIEVGDGEPGEAQVVKPAVTAETVELTVAGKTFVFSRKPPFAVSAR
jgi:hypothetical protein